LERPILVAFTVKNQYTNNGILHLVCQKSSDYKIQKETATGSNLWSTIDEGHYTGPVDYAAGGTQSEDTVNYKAICINGPLNSSNNTTIPTFTAAPITIPYKKTPPPPSVILNAAPRTLAKGSQTTLTWIVSYPVASCIIRATPVCLNGCTVAQITASTTVNAILQNENTDDDDPDTSRPIPSAVNTFIGDPDHFPRQARGKKTVDVNGSMDVEINCGSRPTDSAKVRVTVTSNNEG
jgi:hypothetical protein